MEKQDIEKLAGGTGLTFFGGLVGAGFTYLTGIVIARLVGPELVGIYYFSLIWVHILSALSRFGLSDALLRFVPPLRRTGAQEDCDRAIKTMLLIGAVLALLFGWGLSLLLPPVGARLGWDDQVIAYLRWFFAITPLHALFVLLLMVVQSHQRIARVVIARDIVQPGALLAATVALLWFGADEMTGLIGGFVVSLVIGIGVIARTVRRLTPNVARTPGWMALGPLAGFAMPAMASDMTHLLHRWTDTLMISHFLAFAEVGVYSAAVRTSQLLALIPASINAIFATMASGYFHTQEPGKLERAVQLSLRWCLILGIPAVLVFLLVGRDVLLLWGADFALGTRTLGILAVAQLIAIPGGILAYALLMCNRQTLEFSNTLVFLGLLVGASWLLIPRLGMEGAAYALLGVNAVATGLRAWQVARKLGLRPFGPGLVKPLIAAALASAATLLAGAVLGPMLGGAERSIGQSLVYIFATCSVLGLTYLASIFVLGLAEDDRIITGMIAGAMKKSAQSPRDADEHENRE